MEDYLINLLGFKTKNTTKKEILILEIIIHFYIFQNLYNFFNEELKEIDMEGRMFDGEIIRRLANDLISSDDYSLAGLAKYTGYPEEVIYELIVGLNHNPTIGLANKIIELHVMSRREQYMAFLKEAINTGVLL